MVSTQQPNEIDEDELEPDDESIDTPLVSPFLDLDDDSDDDEVLNELEEYGNAGQFCRQSHFTQGKNNRIACRKFFKKNECEIFTMAEDDVRNSPDGIAPPVL
ncbi:hypothetical protein Tco_0851167 [Tanacetum coccineum]